MKYNKSFERDFNFYLRCISTGDFMFAGERVVYDRFSATGLSAKETFYQIDTFGKSPNCYEPGIVESLLTAKKGINLQIKQWSEGMAELILLPKELQEWCQEWQTPPWVYRSVLNQCSKICRTKLISMRYHEGF